MLAADVIHHLFRVDPAQGGAKHEVVRIQHQLQARDEFGQRIHHVGDVPSRQAQQGDLAQCLHGHAVNFARHKQVVAKGIALVQKAQIFLGARLTRNMQHLQAPFVHPVKGVGVASLFEDDLLRVEVGFFDALCQKEQFFGFNAAKQHQFGEEVGNLFGLQRHTSSINQNAGGLEKLPPETRKSGASGRFRLSLCASRSPIPAAGAGAARLLRTASESCLPAPPLSPAGCAPPVPE